MFSGSCNEPDCKLFVAAGKLLVTSGKFCVSCYTSFLKLPYIYGIPVLRNKSALELSVTISNDLLFEAHIKNILSEAPRRLCVLSRIIYIMHQAFIAHMLLVLEHNTFHTSYRPPWE